MKYKVGDKVRIKSIDWYNKNKDEDGYINCGEYYFVPCMSVFCGKMLIIDTSFKDGTYQMEGDEDEFLFTDEMIEGLAEEESEKKLSDESWKPSKEEMDILYSLAYITNQYDEHKEEIIIRLYQDLKREFFNGSSYENMFPDTEDDVRRRSTIQVLEYARSLDNYNQYGKEDIDKNIAWLEKQGKSALEVRTDNELVEEEAGLVDNLSSRWVNEFNLPKGYIFKDENGNVINSSKIVLEKKKNRYPKTYKECCEVLGWNHRDYDRVGYEAELLCKLQVLLLCRDAYWKISGEEMRLGKPWEPTMETVYCISRNDNVIKCSYRGGKSNILEFPTEEMRDAFYENFNELIEICKGLL